jgi:NADPH-dependent 2,4-dienoyl-CoA reductase/sulfur reductase-like enzyme/peroxiredoxin family protein/rhodanese-related sulfurtransferase/TusA-related sulfurtransferase
VKIVIVGGVAAGASAAARARRLDESAQIIILERGQHVSFANCGLPYHIGGVIRERERLLLQTPQSLQDSLNLEVRVGHEVRAIDRKAHTVTVTDLAAGQEYAESYDKLVLCPGASPIRPRLPGIDDPRIHVLRNVEDMDRIKAALDKGARSAVVIGGGYIGVEMAENLRERGLEVDLVEMVGQLMPPLDPEMARYFEDEVQRRGVRLHLGTAAASFRDTGSALGIELANGKLLAADLVILSVGVKPETSLARDAGLALGPRGGIKVDAHMRTSDPDVYAAGDAVEVTDTVTGEQALIPLAGPANRQGRIAAENICGRTTAYTSTQGTAIVKVFDLTGGCTGASEKTLKRLNRPYRKIYVHPSGHAGYYPGTAPMHIKLLFAPDGGKALGAQVVGHDGVDKRLDVFATAIRAGMTVHDLEGLELSYAPPYGSAKDPVNMAGFVGANVLSGDLDLWYAEDYPEKTAGGIIVDVRGPQEYEVWHVPGSVNIPLPKLRTSLDRIPRDKPVFVYCKVGFRSYLAYRILRQRGFKAATLAGGQMTFSAYQLPEAKPVEPGPATLSYAEERMPVPPAGACLQLDCCGLQCPGPIRKLAETMAALKPGDEITVCATDPGFTVDVAAWCKKHGHALLAVASAKGRIEARIRKSAAGPMTPAACPRADKKTMVVFSGDLDKVLASFVIANGAVSMGSQVTMFFTFWGLNALRRSNPPPVRKQWLDAMFGWMMPRGAGALKLSQMHMLGMGTAMMKHVMRQKNVDALPDLIAMAKRSGVKFVACSMSMDVMGIRKEELIDGVEIGGVASFLGESDEANMTLFI